jgi:DNA-binding LacI/PurR family transcriptional regulator
MKTVSDVARHAGVSPATVSRVLNGNTKVSVDIRNKVLESARQLGYRPNSMAQGLRKGRSNTVALLVGDIAQRHFAELTLHIQSELEAAGMDLLLYNLGHSPGRLKDFLGRAPSMKLRGLMLALSDKLPKDIVSMLASMPDAGVPIVSIGQDMTRQRIPSIVHEEKAAAHRAVTYLLQRGHRRIAYIGKIKGSAIGTERFKGYQAALRAADAYDQTLVWDLTYRYSAGRDAVLRALDRGLAFTGIQAGSDEIAMGAMAALHDRGLAVPRDVAVVGFGDIEMGAYLRPALTTLSSHPDVAARHVCDFFVGDEPAVELTLMRRALIERDSV